MRAGMLPHHVQLRRLVLGTSRRIPFASQILRNTKVGGVFTGGYCVGDQNCQRNYSNVSGRNSDSDFWNVMTSSMSGFWLHLTNETVRDDFQSYVQQNIINQDILTQNMNGRIQMFAVLHGLMNPLLEKYQFDTVEFINAVGPALQIYHETMLQLMTDAATKVDVVATTSKEKESIMKQRMGENADDGVEKKNCWIVEAERDSKSLAGRFIKMVTDKNFGEQYRNAQMIQMFNQMGIPASGKMNYVNGSCTVEYVSLLNIKAVEIDDILYEQNEHPEFAASSEEQQNLPVLARIQVLYKLSRQFQQEDSDTSNKLQQQKPLTSASESYKSINTDVTPSSSSPSNTNDTNTNTGSDTEVFTGSATLDRESEKINETKQDDTTTKSTPDLDTTSATTTTTSNNSNHNLEKYSETRLGVATFEGWLNGGATVDDRYKQRLRWKVASASESNHFW